MSTGSRRKQQEGKRPHVNKYAKESMSAGQESVAALLARDPGALERSCAKAVETRDAKLIAGRRAAQERFDGPDRFDRPYSKPPKSGYAAYFGLAADAW